MTVMAGLQAVRKSPQAQAAPSPPAHGGVVQRPHASDGPPGLDTHTLEPAGPVVAPPLVRNVLRSAGEPLDAATRAFFEPRFGHDFSKVRVHHDQAAATSAHAVQAMAYTVGSNIVFGKGRYAPGTPAGRSLLAHELTHVVQQETAPIQLRQAIPIGPSHSAQEHEANRSATSISSLAWGADHTPSVGLRPIALPVASRVPAGSAQLQRAGLDFAIGSLTTGPGSWGPVSAGPGVGGLHAPGGKQAATSVPPAPPAPPGVRQPAAPPVEPPAKVASPSGEKSADTPSTALPGSPVAENDKPVAPVAEGHRKASPRQPASGKPGEDKGIGSADAGAKTDKSEVGKEARPEAGVGMEAAGEKAPTAPHDDPGFKAMADNVQQAGLELKAHAPASAKATEAQAAAVSPPAELQGRAAAVQAASIDKEQPKPFDRAGFIKALMDKIASIAPKTLGEADDFKKSGKTASIKGDLSNQVESGKTQAQGGIPGKVQQAPDPSGIQPKSVTPLSPADAGPQPADVGAAAAVPKARADAEVSLQAGSEALDHQLTSAQITEKQLENANEPSFQKAVATKAAAQTDALKAPRDFRQGEKGTLGQAQAEAKATAQKDLQGIHGGRAQALDKVANHQSETKNQDEEARARIAADIQKRYDDAKVNTEKRLKQIDADVDAVFEKGATEAQKIFDDEVANKMFHYKLERYTGPAGLLLWAKDALLGLPDEVNVFYDQARQGYIQRMTGLLNSIATIVETGLTEAKAIATTGRKSIDDYLNGLPTALQAVGHEAAQGIQARFDELEHSVEEKQGSLIDALAQKYTEKLQQIDDKIAAMKKENGGLVEAAKDTIGGVIETITNLKKMLLDILAKASAAIDLIIADPIGFLGNLVAAVKKGFLGFIGKIGTYLEQGLIGWLFGALTDAGIQMPKAFDLKGIVGLILEVLGLTYANIRARAVKILGPKVVTALETTAEIFKTLITEGPAGLWKWIKDKVSALKDSVISSIRDFVISKVITAGVTWILSLLNPASAFIKACKAIYDVVMFFVERGQQILALVNAILDSVISIAKGNIAGAAAYVESVLARSVPLVISFLADLLGLGGISEKIKAIIEKIREPINALIDWVINLAVSAVKAVGKLLGFGKEDKKESGFDGELGKVVTFTVGGDVHRLRIVALATGVEVLIASQEKPVSRKLAEYKPLAEKLDGEKKEKVVGLIDQANSQTEDAKVKAEKVKHDSTEPNPKTDQLVAENKAVEGVENPLAANLKAIEEELGIDPGYSEIEKEAAKTQVGNLLDLIHDQDWYGKAAIVTQLFPKRLNETPSGPMGPHAVYTGRERSNGRKVLNLIEGRSAFNAYGRTWRRQESIPQRHHIASDKGTTNNFKNHAAFRSPNGLDIQNDENIIYLHGHAGSHSDSYHQSVREELDAAVASSGGEKSPGLQDKVIAALRSLRVRIRDGTLPLYEGKEVYE